MQKIGIVREIPADRVKRVFYVCDHCQRDYFLTPLVSPTETRQHSELGSVEFPEDCPGTLRPQNEKQTQSHMARILRYIKEKYDFLPMHEVLGRPDPF